MSKEMLIIFVYDTQMIQKEDDDPCTAILYFHPSWVSDQQKTALCGQVMGTVHCVKSVFSSPKIVSLQSGKFHIEEHGRYFMAIGTDRNISNWLLQNRADTISCLIKFFHESIQQLAETCGNSAKLSAKLYQFFETYLKYLFFGGGNVFSYIPSVVLPKSASNVFLEAIQILQTCQELSCVLGGALFYHNKVVATQLSADTTKRIVLTDPYRIKSPAEIPKVNFELPLGVQLLQIYISSKEFHKLHEDSLRSKNINQFLTNKNYNFSYKSNKNFNEPVLSAMKRDQSIIFTSVPEEDSGVDNQSHTVQADKPKTIQQRPKFLNLKNKVSDFNLGGDKKNSVPPVFSGQTSVCSTPMTDLNKIVHSKPMSICINPEEIQEVADNLKPVIEKVVDNDIDLKSLVPYLKIPQINLYDSKKYSSSFDVREKLKSINTSITMKYYNFSAKEKIRSSTDFEDDIPDKCMTIADPTYPIFRFDGTTISHPFYEDYITNQINNISDEVNLNETDRNFENFDYSFTDNLSSIQSETTEGTHSHFENIEMSTLSSIKSSTSAERRKSLSLPLKSLTLDTEKEGNSPASYAVLPTPLMSKLTSFAPEEQSFGANEYRIFTPTQQPQQKFPFSFSSNNKGKKLLSEKSGDRSFEKCVLFVCGQQDVVVSLLLQETACDSHDLIKSLWEICTDNLGKLEKQLHHSLETFPSSSQSDSGEPYSFLCLDSEWDTVCRGGPWASADLGALTYFHRDFKDAKDLTEMLMRCCDGVIYGCKCGQSEIFYHQAANSNAGLPTPADPMANVPLKAKRRLERDHSIILL